MTDLAPVYAALQQADAAGDTASAQTLSDYIRSQSAGAAPAPDASGGGFMSKLGSALGKMPMVAGTELALQAASNLIGKIAGGYGAMATGDGSTVKRVQDAVTYEPRGAVAQSAEATAGQAAQAVMQSAPVQAATRGTNAVLRSIGSVSPTAENVVRTAVPALAEAAPYMLGAAGPLEGPLGDLASYVAKKGIDLPQPLADLAAQRQAALAAVPPSGTAAQRAMVSALQADNVTPGQITSGVSDANAAGQPMAPADVAPKQGNVQGLLRATVTQPGEGRQIATQALLDRGGPASRTRIGDFAATAAGNPSQQAVSAAYQATLPQELGQLGAHPLDVASVNGMLERYEPFQSAHNDMVGSYGAVDAPPPLFDANGTITRPVTLQDINAIKQAIQDRIADLKVPGNVDAKDRAGLLGQAAMLEQLLAKVDQMSPQYAATRALAQRQIGLRNIQDTLAQTANRNTRDFATPVGGAASDSARALEIKEQFPGNPSGVDAFLQQLERERAMLGTERYALGNSQSANKLLDVANLEGGLDTAKDVAAAASGNVMPVLARGANWVSGKWNASRNAELARRLTEPGMSPEAQAWWDGVNKMIEAARKKP